MTTKKINKGFTLIEVLLVMVLIGVLLSIGLVSLNTEDRLIETRNNTRQTHIQTLESAITQYKLQEGNYPTGLNRNYQEICDPEATVCTGFFDIKPFLVPTYIQAIPQDPNDSDTTGGSGYEVAVDIATNTVSVRLKELLREAGVEIKINDPLPAEPTVTANTQLAATVPNLPPVTATGGNITTINENGTWYKVHTFLESDTLSIEAPVNVEYLIVAGGGGGGNGRGGGGGAGGVLTGSGSLSPGNYDIVVGNGGTSQGNGQNSTFFGQIAIGGGAGGTHISSNNGNNGGSGGGGAINYTTVIPQGGTSVSGQGFNGAPGGNTNDDPRNTGGGGGAGEPGTRGSGTTVRPDGGDGIISDITGTPVMYGGGGGGAYGGSDRSTAGLGFGGDGGGGNGGDNSTNPTPGQNGRGGGGGGSAGSGAPGGSGVVIIRYPTTAPPAPTPTPTPTIVQEGLVLHLDAGNTSGTTWTDLSGNNNNGTLAPAPSTPTYSSANGGALVFDGVNDYSRISSFSDDSNLAFSVFCWVYPKNLTVNQFNNIYYNWIINKRNTTSPNSNSWQFLVSNSYPTVAMWDSNGNSVNPSGTSIRANSTSAFQLNRWYYTGFTTDGTNNGSLKIYINDSVNFSGTLTGNRGIETKPIDIGKIGWGDNYFWNGNIAQVSIYNRALTASEIQQNFNATKGRFGL